MAPQLAYREHGNGPVRVIVLHDWFCDSSGWDAMLPYLTRERFTYDFADLRGYGASRDLQGEYTLEEAASDVIALAERHRWQKFSLIGHSMSGLVVQRIGQLIPERVERIAAVTPVPPCGLQMDQASADFFRAMALASDEDRFSMAAPMWGTRLSETWIRYKLRKWRESSEAAAVAKYVDLWGGSGLEDDSAPSFAPLLIVAGEQDSPPFQPAALTVAMMPIYPGARVAAFAECGHYPMQEQPPRLATVMEEFLG